MAKGLLWEDNWQELITKAHGNQDGAKQASHDISVLSKHLYIEMFPDQLKRSVIEFIVKPMYEWKAVLQSFVHPGKVCG